MGKRKLEEESLLSADEHVIEEAVEMSPAETKLMLEYFDASLNLIKKKDATKPKEDALKADVQALKEQLEDELQGKGTCHAYPKLSLNAANIKCSAAGVEEMAPYVRLVSSANDAPITLDVLQTAFEALTTEEVRAAKTEHSLSTEEAFCQALLESLKRDIRKEGKERVVLSKAIERGCKAWLVPDLTDDAAEVALLYHIASEKYTTEKGASCESCKPESVRVDASKPQVLEAMARMGCTSQPIALEGGDSYKILRRKTTRKPKVTTTVISRLLSESLGDVHLNDWDAEKLSAKSKAEAAKLLRIIQAKLTSIPGNDSYSLMLVKSEE